MDIIKDKIRVREAALKIKKEITIEQSYIIPDIKPDIVKNIIANGNIFIEKSEIQSKRIKIDGKLLVFDMYLDNEENNNSLDMELDFSEILDANKLNDEEKVDCDSNININKIEVRILNERKIHVVSTATIDLTLYVEKEISIVRDIDEKDSKIEKLEKKMTLNSLVGSGSSRATIKENLKVTDVEKVINIVKVQYSVENIDSKISYNKVLAKGDVLLEILYRTEENKINRFSTTLPLMAFIDIKDVTDTNISKLKMFLANMKLCINTDNTISIEMEFECKCNVYENKEINLIEDIYGIKKSYKYNKKCVNLETENNEKLLTQNINEKVLVDNINQLYDTSLFISITNKEAKDGIIKFTGMAEVRYLYDTFDNKNIQSMDVNFEFMFELGEENSDIEIKVTNSNFIVLPDSSIDNRIEINIVRKSSESRNVEIIDDIEEDDDKEFSSYSLVIYFVQKGDSLWKIAKKFRSTVDQIARINNIENEDKIDVGQKLYIPKAV